MVRSAAIVLASILSACAGAPPGEDWIARARALHAAASPGFPKADVLLTGFEPGTGERIADGDRLLYGLRLAREGKEQTWLILFTVSDEFVEAQGSSPRERKETPTFKLAFTPVGGELVETASTTRRCLVTVYEEGWRQVHVSVEYAPIDLLRFGILDPVGKGKDFDTTRHALGALVALSQTFQRNKPLADILWQVVDKPSLFSILTGLGTHVDINPRFELARPGPDFVRGTTRTKTTDLPLEILVNQTPALRFTILATKPDGALGLNAGILAVAGFRPKNERTRFWLQLLAVRRGG